jgi:hypothetical protein
MDRLAATITRGTTSAIGEGTTGNQLVSPVIRYKKTSSGGSTFTVNSVSRTTGTPFTIGGTTVTIAVDTTTCNVL